VSLLVARQKWQEFTLRIAESKFVCPATCIRGENPAQILPGIAAEPRALEESADLALGSARGAMLYSLVSRFGISIPLLICRALFVLLYVAAPRMAADQNSATNDKQLGTVQTQMRNVRYHFSDTVVVEIKSLNGELVPLGNNEFPVFDDKNSFNLRIDTAEIAIDSSNLANVLNTYVFASAFALNRPVHHRCERTPESEGKAP
jgi:hypothetical protein